MESYNPVLRTEAIVKRGLGTPRPRSPVGVAHVLYGPGTQALVLQHGRRLKLSDSMLGRYTQAFHVDLSMKRLEWTADLPCRGDAYNFKGTFEMTCWVSDPAMVVRQNIQDAGAILWSAVKSRAWAISRKHDLIQTAKAEASIATALATAELHPAFGTYPIQVHLSPDPEAVKIGRLETNTTVWNAFVDNPAAAAYLAEHPGDINGALAVIRELIQQHEEGIESYRSVGGRVGPELKAIKKNILDRQARQLGFQPHAESPAPGIRPILPPRESAASTEEDEEKAVTDGGAPSDSDAGGP